MQVFLVENSQKTGPFTPWEVRGRLERGEISPDTLGWHDGCESWVPLRDLPVIGYRDQEDMFPTELPPLLVPGPETAHPAATETPSPWRRLWARAYDLTLWHLIAALALKPFHVGFDKFLLNPAIQLASLALLLLAEAACLAILGTTPGKALLGLHVRQTKATPDGSSPIPFPLALQRTFYAFALGNAFFSIFAIATWIFHYVSLTRNGATWWDRKLGFSTVALPLSPFRPLIFASAFLATLWLLQFLVGPETNAMLESMMRGGKP